MDPPVRFFSDTQIWKFDEDVTFNKILATPDFQKIHPIFSKIQLLIFLRNRHRLSFEKSISPASPIFFSDEVRVLKFEIS